jgi:hypothetical protein
MLYVIKKKINRQNNLEKPKKKLKKGGKKKFF